MTLVYARPPSQASHSLQLVTFYIQTGATQPIRNLCLTLSLLVPVFSCGAVRVLTIGLHPTPHRNLQALALTYASSTPPWAPTLYLPRGKPGTIQALVI